MKLILTAAALAMMAGTAFAKDASCELTVEGVTYVSGPCDFTGDSDGSFRVFTETGYAVYADMVDGRMKVNWNEATREAHAHASLGILSRSKTDSACWINDTARLCAW